jgi:hypothetical protein
MRTRLPTRSSKDPPSASIGSASATAIETVKSVDQSLPKFR